MPGMMDGLSTINSVLRTLLAMVIVALLGGGSWIAYQTYNEGDLAKANLEQTKKSLADAEKQLEDVRGELTTKQAQLDDSLREIEAKTATIAQQENQISELNVVIDEKNEVIEKQATAMRLLKQDHRLAIVSVVDQKEEDGQLFTTVRWQEVADDGRPIDQPRTFKLKGDVVKIDAWVVKFDDNYIEEADLIRGTSICLFRGIHGEFPTREEVYPLDQVGSLPNAYRRGGQVSDFEREIWDDFWEISNNPDRAEELGIRAAHGEVVYNKVRPGMKYKVELRSSGGLTLKPLAADEADPTAKPSA